MRVRRTKRTVLIVFAAIVVLGGLRYVEVFIWPGPGPNGTITISRETTYFTEPLNDDGTVNYIAAVNQRYGKGVTVENNAAVLVMRAVGLERMTKANRREFLLRLGVSSPPKRGDRFVTLDDYVVASVLNEDEKKRHAEARRYSVEVARRLMGGGGIGPRDRGKGPPDPARKFSDNFNLIQGKPWTAKDYPVLADWLKANEKPLSLLMAASQRSRYFVPLVSDSQPPDYFDAAVSGPGLSRLQSMLEVLEARAKLRAGREDFEGAHADLMTLHRLGRLLATRPELIEKLLGVVVAGQGGEGHLSLARAGWLTADQARRVAADLDGLSTMPDLVDAFDVGERLVYLSGVTSLARATGGGGRKGSPLVPEETTGSGIDWNRILRNGNVRFDRWVEAARKKTFAERSAALAVVNQELSEAVDLAAKQMRGVGRFSLSARLFFAGRQARRRIVTEILERALFTITAVSIEGTMAKFECNVMRSDLVTVAMGLTAYRIERGEYPAKLSGLSADYLSKIPPDRFVDRPLVYRREGSGCVVYSLGPNMKDDEGRKNDESWDDIVIRLGNDAPATMPAESE